MIVCLLVAVHVELLQQGVSAPMSAPVRGCTKNTVMEQSEGEEDDEANEEGNEREARAPERHCSQLVAQQTERSAQLEGDSLPMALEENCQRREEFYTIRCNRPLMNFVVSLSLDRNFTRIR